MSAAHDREREARHKIWGEMAVYFSFLGGPHRIPDVDTALDAYRDAIEARVRATVCTCVPIRGTYTSVDCPVHSGEQQEGAGPF